MEHATATLSHANELASALEERKLELAAEQARGAELKDALEALQREGRNRMLITLELAAEARA